MRSRLHSAADQRSPFRWRWWVFKSHRWLALALGWALTLLGLSGSALVYRAEIDLLLHPQMRVTAGAGDRISFQKIMEVAFEQFSRQSGEWLLTLPTTDTLPVKVTYVSNDLMADSIEPINLWIHPYQPELLRMTTEKEDLLEGWLYRFHSRFLMGDTGKLWTSALGSALLGLLIMGVYLWWPHRFRRPRLNTGSIHRWLGFLGVPVLLMSALTGLYLALPSSWVPWLHIQENESMPAIEITGKQPASVVEISPDHAVSTALRAFPEGRLRQIRLPQFPGEPYMVSMHLPGSADCQQGWLVVWVDSWENRVIYHQLPADQGFPGWLQRWVYPLHNGTAFGETGRLLMGIGGLMPGILTISGTYGWWRRKTRRRHGVFSDKAVLQRRVDSGNF